jgi:ketosteroid isomerase-like protein
MSEENVEIIRAAWESYANGDIAEMLKDIAPNIVLQRWPPLPDPEIYHGPDGLLQLVADWIEDFDEFETTVEEFIDANDTQVITRVHQQATGAGSGVPIEAQFWFVWTLTDGRVVRWDIYKDRDHALEAAGLTE